MIFKSIYLLCLLFTFIISSDYNSNNIIKQLSSSKYQKINDIQINKNDRLLDNVINNDTYKIGPGDELYINIISNNLVVNNTFVVSPSGDLIIPSLGMINVYKLYISDVINAIDKICAQKFEKYELNITISNLRSFRIKILGLNHISSIIVQHVDKVSDVYNYIVNDLYDSESSSLLSERNVTLKRVKNEFDIDVMKVNMGMKTFDDYVEEGDRIIFNYKEDFIDIYGSVKNPGRYEFKKEDSLSEILQMSGILYYSDSDNIVINRSGEEIIVNIDDDISINKNDYIFMNSTEESIQRKYAIINGSVKYPGKYIVTNNMVISELITKAGGFLPNADLNSIKINNETYNKIIDSELLRISNILPQNRSNSEISYMKSRKQTIKGSLSSSNSEITNDILNYIINNNDIIYIPEINKNIEIIGAVKTPGTYPLNFKYSINDYILKSGGENNLSSKKYYIINGNGEKIKINKSFRDIKYGDIIYVEPKQDVNNWNKFKEIMSVVGQIATLLAVVQSAQN